MKTVLYIVIGILIGLFLAGLLWLAVVPPPAQPITLLPTPTPSPLKVYITGAVLAPGVYELPVGSRVQDAVEAAGGFLPDAAREQVNLAALVEDGIQIHIPFLTTTSRTQGGRVNINTATADELATLPGIGPTTAQRIVEYRLQHGFFRTIQDIQNVPGIGPTTFEKIRDYITVGP